VAIRTTTASTYLSTLSLPDALPICFQLLDGGGTVDVGGHHHHRLLLALLEEARQLAHCGGLARALQAGHQHHRRRRGIQRQVLRSEEHTSELQSRENLVCRLLLEKK